MSAVVSAAGCKLKSPLSIRTRSTLSFHSHQISSIRLLTAGQLSSYLLSLRRRLITSGAPRYFPVRRWSNATYMTRVFGAREPYSKLRSKLLAVNVLLAWLTAHLEFIGRILHHWEKTRGAPMKVGQISLTSGYPFIRQELCHSRQRLALPKKRRSKKKWTSSLNATQSSTEFTQCHAFSTAFQPVIYGTSTYLEMKVASTRLSIYFKTPKYPTAMLPTHSTSILWVVWLKFWRCLFQFSTKSSSPKKALLYPQQSRPDFSAHPIRASETWERSRLTPL